ncbi:MAG: hypothetical protein A4E64_01103 [Syntrophorhabdus sp. PtaU1.Bin058]|nr:MAG: hypothetical protein A4E64_01103 [Syntrophorhabdus sp. PtaU1.Bin058]
MIVTNRIASNCLVFLGIFLKNLKLVANGGIETNKDSDSITDPAFILGGITMRFWRRKKLKKRGG